MLVNRKKFCSFENMEKTGRHKSKNVGNKHNQVWSAEKANAFISEVFNYALQNDKCRSMATACSKCGGYEELISYFKKQPYAESIDFKPIKAAHEIFKGRLMEQGLDGEANATMAIFILKNNHGMSDKVETKNDNLNINADKDITADEVKAIKNALNDAY